MRRRSPWAPQRAPTDLVLVLLLIMVAVSVLLSPLPQRSLAALGPLAGGIVLYLLLAKWPWTRAQWNRIAWGIILMGAGIGLVGMLVPDLIGGQHPVLQRLPLVARLQRWLPDGFNPNVIAGAMVLLLPFGVARTLAVRGVHGVGCWLRRIIAAMATVVMLGVLILSESRGGYLAAALGLLLLAFLCWQRVGRRVVPFLILAAIVAGSLIGWKNVIEAILFSASKQGLSGREEVWSRTFYIIADFPFTGAGLGCFEPVVAMMYPMFTIAGGTTSHAHNLFLQVAVDLGLPGLIAYLATLGMSFYLVFLAYRFFSREDGREPMLLCAACIAALAGMVLHGLIDCAVWGNKGAFIAWIVLGLSAAMYRLAQEEAA
jgi:putative inorganic carbon (HCO3(-)) transporter